MLEELDNYNQAFKWLATSMSFLDFLLTGFLVKKYGHDAEANPIIKYIIRNYGLVGMWIFWLIIWSMAYSVFELSSWIFLSFWFFMHVVWNLYVLWDNRRFEASQRGDAGEVE
jgi:hypothetical protein